jgi:heavy metal sensor kinase
VAVGGGYLLVSRALRPVERMAGKAEIISVHRLGELLPVARTGDELERLAESLNRMIVRLEDAISNSKRFVADASHELRTPLTILRGELEGLVQDKRIPAELNQRIDSMLEETERLAKIVEGLVALSRLDAGESQTEWVRFDLAALATSTADQMSLLAEDKKIALTCEKAEDAFIQGDRARIKQVVVNLLGNAIKYTPEGGQVRLAVRAHGGQAILEVADTGSGIPPEALPHIFQRFYRADESRSQDPEGAGLGLSIVQSICHAHSAEITVESTPGQGSRFQVKFPSWEAKVSERVSK